MLVSNSQLTPLAQAEILAVEGGMYTKHFAVNYVSFLALR